MKRTIEIEDTLADRIESAKDDLQNEFKSFREENPKMAPKDWEPHDRISEITDSATPIYNGEIRNLWYLYSNDFEQAYDDAGIYGPNERPDNYEQVAIYCYIEAQLWEEARKLMDEAQDEYESADDTEA